MFSTGFMNKETSRAIFEQEMLEADLLRRREVNEDRWADARKRSLEQLMEKATEITAAQIAEAAVKRHALQRRVNTAPQSTNLVAFLTTPSETKAFIEKLDMDFDSFWNGIKDNRKDCVAQLLSASYAAVQFGYTPTLLKIIKRLAIRLGLTQYTQYI